MGFECRKRRGMIPKASRKDLFLGSEQGNGELSCPGGSVPRCLESLNRCRRTLKTGAWRRADTLRAGLAATVADSAIGRSAPLVS